jgi:eukaryotic-like serine/threonine-protein kinase
MDLIERYCPHCGAAYGGGEAACMACGASLKVTKQLDASKNPSVTPSLRLAIHLQTLQLFNERYRIVRQVGAGGFGAVYEAADTWEPRHVAIKEIGLTGLSAQQVIEATGSFNREVQMLSSLQHAGIPRIYEHLKDSDHWYLVMEFVAGKTLERMQEQTSGGRLPLAQVLSIGVQICTVLEHLHSQRPAIIFRDIKPANIMLTPEGYLYLIDFGVARRYQKGSTRDTIAFGSPGFAAPEQYGRAQTTPLSDIYSLGALLYCLLTGDDPSEHPFQFPPLRLYGIDGIRELDALIQRMVAPNPTQRPQRVRIELQHIQQIHYQSTKRTPLWIPPKGQTPPALAVASKSNQQSAPSALTNKWPQGQVSPTTIVASKVGQQQQIAPAPAASPASASKWPQGQASPTTIVASKVGQQQQVIPASAASKQPQPTRKTTRRRMLAGGLIASGTLLTVSLVTVWENNHKRVSATMNYTTSAVDGATPTTQSTETTPATQSIEATPSSSSQNPVVPANGTTYWSTDMNYAVVFNESQQQLEVYSAKKQSLLRIIPLSDSYSVSIVWSPDNSRIFLYDNTSGASVWDIQGEKQPYTLPQTANQNTVAWSPDSQYLTASGISQTGVTLFLLRATNGKQLFQTSFADAGALNYIAWSPDSHYLVFPTITSNNWLAGTPWSMEIWDSQTWQKVSEIGGTLPISHAGSFYYALSGVAWSPDGTTIAVGLDNDVWLIHLAHDQGSPRQIRTSILSAAAANNSAGFASNVLTWAPNSRYLAISQNEGYGGLNIYDVSNKKNVLSSTNGSVEAFVALAWATNSKSITTADDRNIVSTWKIP